MIVFITSDLRNAIKIPLAQGSYTIKTFSDGELFLRLDQEVRSKKTWVVASTQAPAENLLELLFLLDALQRAGAEINLLITYFGYARQIVAGPEEAASGTLISSFFKNFDLKKTLILHAHSNLLHDFLSYQDLYDYRFFCDAAANYDAIVAPDRGAYSWAQEVARLCKKEIIVLSKTRPDHEQVEITAINGNVKGKRLLLVDDIISTGRTLVQSADALKSMGALAIGAAAMHGIFSKDGYMLLEKSSLESITVSNSTGLHAYSSSKKIKIHDISSFITKTIEENR